MRQLMRDQSAPHHGVGRWLTSTDDDVLTHGISPGLHRGRRLGGSGIGVYAHLTEVLPKASLHECPGLRIEGFAGGA
jgi:hypothetical protein